MSSNIYTVKLIILVLCLGCTPTTIKVIPLSKKAMKEKNHAIPYYLPKPYLLLTKNISTTITKQISKKETKKDGIVIETITKESIHGDQNTTDCQTETEKFSKKDNTNIEKTSKIIRPTKDFNRLSDIYSYQIIYLPDLDYKYGIEIDKGESGTFDTEISLENGWKLTGINMASDTKSAETISAVGETISALGSVLEKAVIPRLSEFEDIPEDTLKTLISTLKEMDRIPELWLYSLEFDGKKYIWECVLKWPDDCQP